MVAKVPGAPQLSRPEPCSAGVLECTPHQILDVTVWIEAPLLSLDIFPPIPKLRFCMTKEHAVHSKKRKIGMMLPSRRISGKSRQPLSTDAFFAVQECEIRIARSKIRPEIRRIMRSWPRHQPLSRYDMRTRDRARAACSETRQHGRSWGSSGGNNEADNQPPSQPCGSDGSAGQLQLFGDMTLNLGCDRNKPTHVLQDSFLSRRSFCYSDESVEWEHV